MDPFTPSPALLIKLGSLARHAEEIIETAIDVHEADRGAVKGLLANEDVSEWMATMDARALLPVKR